MPLVSANLISDWRRALEAELGTAYPAAVIEPRRRTGVNRDSTPRISVFHDGYAEQAGRVVVAEPVMIIRFWPSRSSLETAYDPTELEQAEMDLLRLLQDRQSQIELAVDDLWYFRPQSALIDDDEDEWGVEIRLRGFAKNIAVVA